MQPLSAAGHLFFYGVLQDSLAQGGVRDLLAGIGPGEPATTRGVLFAVAGKAGCYPAMIAGEGTVRGMLHEAGSVDLAPLDAFEGAQYRREEIAAQTGQGAVAAQAYIWVDPVAGLEAIAHGDFARWLAETGNRPLTG